MKQAMGNRQCAIGNRQKANKIFVYCLLLIAYCLFFNKDANAQSLKFRKDSTWANVLVEAKRQHKPIFLDVYTTWCKPCKQLEHEVFSLTSVGEKLNSSFICYRIDAEKGEGVEIASSYQVQSYPALFFLDTKGNEIHKIDGLVSPERFLVETDFVLNLLTDDKQIGTYKTEFEKGNRQVDFLYKYLKKKALYKEDAGLILEEYIKQLPFDSLNTSRTWALIMNNATLLNGKTFELLMSRRQDEKVLQKLARMRVGAFNLAIRTQNEQVLEEALTVTQRLARNTIEAQEITLSQQMLFYLATKNKVKLPQYSEVYLSKFVMNKSVEQLRKQDQNQQVEEARLSNHFATQLGRIAQFYVENYKEADKLQLASLWAKRSVELAEKSSNLAIYAQILYKLGNVAEAKNIQEKAINFAKNAKEDTEYISELKEELEKM